MCVSGKGKEGAVEKLVQFASDCNKKDFGKKITFSDIMAFALLKLNESDIKKIQDQSMSKMDQLKKKFKDSAAGSESKEDFAEWVLANLSTKAKALH